MLKWPNDGKEFLIIGRVLPLRVTQLLTKVGNGMAFLSEDSSNPNPGWIILYLKDLLKTWQGWNRCLDELLFDLLKGLLCFWSPLERGTLENFDHWSRDGAKVYYEPPIEGGKSIEAPHIMNAWGCWPWPNSFYVTLIHLDTLGRDNISEEGDLLSTNGTLLGYYRASPP